MTEQQKDKQVTDNQTEPPIDEDAMEQGFHHLETIYRSRSVQSPKASNVTIREIKKDE